MGLFRRKKQLSNDARTHREAGRGERQIDALQRKIETMERQVEQGDMSIDLHDEEERMEDCVYDLVGESHYRDELQQLVDAAITNDILSVVDESGWVRLGIACWLVPEPENEYDSAAVAVFAGDVHEPAFSFRVGYLPRGAGSKVKDWERVPGMIIGRLDETPRWGVKIDWCP